jgi:hypothetical protein
MKTVKIPFKTAVFAPAVLGPYIEELVGWYLIESHLMDVVVRMIIERASEKETQTKFQENNKEKTLNKRINL